ncbi:MAG: hypothetical protein ACTHJQ_02165 [Rhizobiaceae bacterium]
MNTFQQIIPQGCPDSSLAGQFNTWIANSFRDKADFDKKGVPTHKFSSITAYYERHLYLVTMLFRNGLGAARDGRSPVRNGYLFDSIYKGWYLTVCKKLLGRKFHKKPIRQPFSMAFLDVEGSRHHQAASAFQIPHIHALLLIPPASADRFRQLTKNGILEITKDARISNIDVQPFRDQGQSASPTMSYAAKYAREMIRSDRLEKGWSVFPDLDASLYPFYGTAGRRLYQMTRCKRPA